MLVFEQGGNLAPARGATTFLPLTSSLTVYQVKGKRNASL